MDLLDLQVAQSSLLLEFQEHRDGEVTKVHQEKMVLRVCLENLEHLAHREFVD